MNPSPIDLTTIDGVKAYLSGGGSQVSSADDDLIQDAITAFSQWALSFTGRDSLSGVALYTEIYDGNGSYRIFTRNSPILAVSSIQVNGVTVQPSSAYNTPGYYIELEKRSIAIRSGGNASFTVNSFSGGSLPYAFLKGFGNIQIVYSAGYVASAINEQQTIAAQTIPLANTGWYADNGVSFYPSLVPLTKVTSNPAAGQYAVSNGTYVFNVTDNAKAVVVTYQYSSGAPADLEYAARQTVGINYKRKDYRDHASKSMSTGGGSATTSYRDWKFPPEVGSVLQNYRRLTP